MLMLNRFPTQVSPSAMTISNLQGKRSCLTSPLPLPTVSALLHTLSCTRSLCRPALHVITLPPPLAPQAGWEVGTGSVKGP